MELHEKRHDMRPIDAIHRRFITSIPFNLLHPVLEVGLKLTSIDLFDEIGGKLLGRSILRSLMNREES